MSMDSTFGESGMPSKESREERFKRIATRRTKQIMRQLRLLGNTAGPNYKRSSHDVETIFAAIRKAVADTEARFSRASDTEFSL